MERKVITSRHNQTISHLKQLVNGTKYRSKHHQTILDGIHLADAYLRAGETPWMVVVGTGSLAHAEVRAVLDRLDPEYEVIEVPDSLYEWVSPLTNGVALLMVIDLPEVKRELVIEGDTLLLDGVQDPGNVGTILRTAAAAGVKDVYLSAGAASVWSPKALRAGMGAQFGLTVFEDVDLASVIKDSTVPVYATSLEGSSSLYGKDLSGAGAWLFGNEGAGVSPELLRLCQDNLILIPQTPGVESLNVAAAAAVCLFEQRRQRL